MKSTMTPRQRTFATLSFGRPDRVPLAPGSGRESTRAYWRATGLPSEVRNINEFAYREAGGTLEWPSGGAGFGVNERMIPQFEEKVLEDLGDSHIVQDWKGNVCEIAKEFSPVYLRNAMDFVTRRWVRCPVENWSDWESMKRRYDPDDPTRVDVAAAQAVATEGSDRPGFLELHFSGPFWQLREWLGFETLCTQFYDDPAMVRDMLAFWSDYIERLLRNVLRHVTPDCVHISEDMAYKAHAMISPAMCREYLLPVWKRWGELIRGAGVPFYACDSDGYIGELIPLWIEAGINACDPIEVAAHNDIVAFRRQFGRDMAFRGGVDKRAIAKGGHAIEEEIARLRPVIDDGGYLPGCDHGVPADVAWPDYVRYVGLLARATGWL